MQIIVKARHMNLTPALKAHAEQKLSDAVMRVFDRPAAKIDIELNILGHVKDGNDNECLVTVFMPQNKTVVITEVADNMYKAIDLAHHRLLMQVKRATERKKKTTQLRKAAARDRAGIARSNLTAGREVWEEEVVAFEQSMARA